MRLNSPAPKGLERLLCRLVRVARLSGRPESRRVLDAVERHLNAPEEPRPIGEAARLPAYHMGVIAPFRRADIYDDVAAQD